MLRIGLTGGIGSGKSLVACVFRVLGVPVFEADTEARLLMEQHAVLKQKICLAFGEDVYRDGRLQRKKLAGIVFPDPEKLKVLNGLVHPYVFEAFDKWILKVPDVPYVLHEAAILFESGGAKCFDAVIAVEAPEELRIQRVILRDGVERQEVFDRMKNQWETARRTENASYVLWNDNNGLLLPVILNWHASFSKGVLP